MASQEERDAAAAQAAAAAQLQATREALQFLKDLYSQQRADQLPWMDTGRAALDKQAYLMGLGGRVSRGQPQWTIPFQDMDISRRNEPPGRGDWPQPEPRRKADDPIPYDPTPPDDPTQPRRRGNVLQPIPDDFSGGYASNPLALIAGVGRRPNNTTMVKPIRHLPDDTTMVKPIRHLPDDTTMVKLMAPTGEVRSVSAAQARYYLAKGARPV